MSKRVYEIAREQSLESKEVIQRLKEAGVEVKSHSSSVEDNVYERVFGAGPSVETPNGRSRPRRPARMRSARDTAPPWRRRRPKSPSPEPQQSRPQKKRRRVVIDASARNRARPARLQPQLPVRSPSGLPSRRKCPTVAVCWSSRGRRSRISARP